MLSTVELKKQVVSEIVEKIKNSKGLVLVDYKGITVKDATALRSEFRKSDVEYKVLKNTMVKRALNQLGYKNFDKDLNGTTAVAFSNGDELAAAKIITEGIKKNYKLQIKSGMVGGQYVGAEDVKAIANIPSKNVLIGQLLGMLLSPIRSFAVAISQIAEKKA